MLRHILATTLAGAALLGATAAQAGTNWSVGIGISLPPADIVVSNGGRYVDRNVYYAPPPVVYAPAPRYVERDVYYAPAPRVVYERSYHDRWDRRDDHWRRDHDRRGHDRRENWARDRRNDGPQRGGRW
ncbi:MAG: hypothetical protein EOP39_20210 [Rubrivivax sp.]|nr:MAG: hypothetical protein EOP39_20210 [Rubrivivax sp.]